MLVVLNYSHVDRQRALELLRWIGELGGAHGHELLLGLNRLSIGSESELVDEAKKHFDNVGVTAPPDEDERGWPYSPNHAWRHVVYWVRERIQKDFLWLEPDCVPLPLPNGKLWIDEISKAWDARPQGKHFMGCDVNVSGSKRHMSGIAVYPAKVVAFTRRMPELNGEAWDMFFAEEFFQFSHFTPLVQHVQHHPGYPDIPTFPTQESLSIIRPETVLWHRCKDGSLIERLRERMPPKAILTSATISSGNGYVELPSKSLTGPSEADILRQQVEQLKQQLQERGNPRPVREKATKPKKKRAKRVLTEAQKQILRERMALARAAKKPAAA